MPSHITTAGRDGTTAVDDLTEQQVNEVAAGLMGYLSNILEGRDRLSNFYKWTSDGQRIAERHPLNHWTTDLNAAADFERACMPDHYYLLIWTPCKDESGDAENYKAELYRHTILYDHAGDSEPEARTRAVIYAVAHSRGSIEVGA